jgi:hypothetical protein
MYLTKEQILSAQDIKTTDVDVPEWGGVIRVRNLSALERRQLLRKSMEDELDEDQTEIAFFVKCIVDETGQPLFNADEIKAIANKSASAYTKIVSAVLNINALTTDAIEDIKKK